eukprot:CAMPEP_0174827568 /NCGR_PEP_ID=MMETSP1114-20130205/805_1 /TAXON_ID=312471 /ORGANISM="Neobodo designis, Strain CCAP 1951/1" /LENGTH=165 /DNA_ID=CAMNT_0016061231 /DNA_START=208 /DNA_END=705 /DNA_ORIENTATION=+
MSWRARFSPLIGGVITYINPKDPACFGVRGWWRTNLPELQLLNPMTNFTISEIAFGEPIMYIQYSPHNMRLIRIAGATEEEIEDILEACVNYGQNHAIVERPRGDDAGDPTVMDWISSFGYTETFMAKIDVTAPADVGQRTNEGVDDPGQKPRVYPRNTGIKIMP